MNDQLIGLKFLGFRLDEVTSKVTRSAVASFSISKASKTNPSDQDIPTTQQRPQDLVSNPLIRNQK